MKRKVFISYAHKDRVQVDAVARTFAELNFDVWLDTHSIRGGDLWSREISQAISGCDFFVLFISKTSMKSDPVRREVDLAYNSNRNMILVRLDQTRIPPEIAYQVSGIQWIDTSDKDWMSRLLESLRSKKTSSRKSADHPEASADHSASESAPGIHIGGDAKNSVIILGNNNVVGQKKQKK